MGGTGSRTAVQVGWRLTAASQVSRLSFVPLAAASMQQGTKAADPAPDSDGTNEPECRACANLEEGIPPTLQGQTGVQQPAGAGLCLAYAHSECPVNRKELGRSTWAFLHTLAAYYPEDPSETLQADIFRFMEIMARIYPCRYCSDRTVEELEINPPRVSNQKEFSVWMCEIHNEVNERMGKPIFDCSKVNERWKYGPADGSCQNRTPPARQ
eukprot:gb/GEZN01014094.1/.p1 GENE.gb/GEZN01014094.1/~~gb/GEZN01014094.1/.p1  ORF type:complete len:212 (+),score=20.04 gb/GEZN01014094.1/:84-719(+)